MYTKSRLEKYEGKRPLETRRTRWEDNIKIDLRDCRSWWCQSPVLLTPRCTPYCTVRALYLAANSWHSRNQWYHFLPFPTSHSIVGRVSNCCVFFLNTLYFVTRMKNLRSKDFFIYRGPPQAPAWINRPSLSASWIIPHTLGSWCSTFKQATTEPAWYRTTRELQHRKTKAKNKAEHHNNEHLWHASPWARNTYKSWELSASLRGLSFSRDLYCQSSQERHKGQQLNAFLCYANRWTAKFASPPCWYILTNVSNLNHFNDFNVEVSLNMCEAQFVEGQEHRPF
jgi:hypothetical protein